MTKKITALLCALVLLISLFGGCSQAGNNSGKLKIVTTIFPVYDWVKNLTDGAGSTELTMLIDTGVDLHSFQPSAQDIVNISTCDMFIYIGGESDKWVDDALKEKVNDDMVIINLMDALGGRLKAEEAKEGMQEEAEEEDEEEEEMDEHIWLSLKNAVAACEVIADKLSSLDKQNAKTYESNSKAYIKKLGELDRSYQSAVSSAKEKTLVVADRFPFRYLTDDYGLDYYAAFSGCSAETEASFKTIAFLAKKVDELKLNCVFKLEGSDGKVADTVIENTKSKTAKVLTLDSMQSTTSKDVKSGSTYLSIMQKNLDTLKTAFKE